MADEVKFGKYSFSSMNACIVAAKRKVRSYDVAGKIPAADEDFFKELLKLHPDYESKRGVGLASIGYGYCRNFNTKCLIAVRVDGSEQAFSWMSCLKSPTAKHRVQAVFRELVLSDTTALRASTVFGVVNCHLTGERLGFNTSRVIYIEDLSFNDLVNEFLGFLDTDYNKVDMRCSRNGNESGLVLHDKLLAEKWKKYHKEMAVMTLISTDPKFEASHDNCA